MTSAQAIPEPVSAELSDVDIQRAGFYAALSRALVQPPDEGLLQMFAALDGDGTPLGEAMRGVAASARGFEGREHDLSDEYARLFYGMGQGGEVLPYASYYLTGSLHDQPLAAVREDMRRLGLAHGAVNSEPEDHVGHLFEVMHGLVTGAFAEGEERRLAEQREFFRAHVAPWAEELFKDLEAASSADFYAALARLACEFLHVEEEAFALTD